MCLVSPPAESESARSAVQCVFLFVCVQYACWPGGDGTGSAPAVSKAEQLLGSN